MKLFGHSSAEIPVPRRRLSDDTIRERAAEPDSAYRFRRNRTLTGSPSPQLDVAADQKTHLLVTPRQQAHQLRRRRRNIGMLLGASLAISAMLWWGMNNYIAEPVLRLEGLPLVKDTGSYRSTVNDYFRNNPFERMIPLVDQKKLLAYLQSYHPEVKSVAVTPGAFSRPNVALGVRRPVASWTMGGSNKYVDGQGVAFDNNFYEAPPIQIVDQTGIRAESVSVVASNRFLGFIGKLVGAAGARSLPIEKIVIPAGTTHQVYGYVEGSAYPIKLSVDREAEAQAEDMNQAIAYMKKHNLTPEYLDVRVDRRVFYR